MIDPFTLATGIVGVVSLAVQLTQVTKDYAKSATNATETTKHLATELDSLSDVLKQLETFLKDQSQRSLTFEETAVICKAKDACQATLVSAHKKLRRPPDGQGAAKLIAHIRWPSNEKYVKGLIVEIQRYVATFQYSLTIQGCGVLSKTSLEVGELLKNQVEQLEKTKLIAMFYPSLAKEVEASLTVSSHVLDLMRSSTFTQPLAKIDKLSDDMSKLVALHEAASQREEISTLIARKERIIELLADTDPSTNFREACSKRAPGTSGWLLSDLRFRTWLAEPKSLLWIHGIAGSGKTILSSTIISDCLAREVPVAYYFFDFNDSSKQNVTAFLRSCLAQLCRAIPYNDLPRKDIEVNDASLTIPTLLTALREVMRKLSNVIIVADAIDECQEHIRPHGILSVLTQIKDWNSHVVVTSKYQHDLIASLESAATSRIEVEGVKHEADIALYVDQRLKDGRLQKWSENAKNDIHNVLKASAGNLFRWVTLQCDTLEKCITQPILKRTLQSLPQTLFETYDTIINDMDKDYRGIAIVALQWLVYTDFPMTVEAIAEIMSITTEAPRTYSPENRLRSSDDVLSVCSGLVTIQYQGQARIVRLAHSTVRDYLISAKITGLPPIDQREVKSREIIAQCSIAIMRYVDSLTWPDEVDDFGVPTKFCLPHQLRWFLSDLGWATGLQDMDDLAWVISKAQGSSKIERTVETYIRPRSNPHVLQHHTHLRAGAGLLKGPTSLEQRVNKSHKLLASDILSEGEPAASKYISDNQFLHRMKASGHHDFLVGLRDNKGRNRSANISSSADRPRNSDSNTHVFEKYNELHGPSLDPERSSDGNLYPVANGYTNVRSRPPTWTSVMTEFVETDNDGGIPAQPDLEKEVVPSICTAPNPEITYCPTSRSPVEPSYWSYSPSKAA